MAKITPQEAQRYADRWALINTYEIEELRRTSMETKLRQLASLMASRDVFGADPRREEEAEEVRRRWAQLRRVLGG